MDLSEPTVELAARRAGVGGVDNAQFRQAAAQVEDFRLGRSNVVISRFGTMFFADAVAAAGTALPRSVPAGACTS